MRHLTAALFAAVLLALIPACDGPGSTVGADEAPGPATSAHARAPVSGQAVDPVGSGEPDVPGASARGTTLAAPLPPGDANRLPPIAPAPMWSEEGLEAQPRMSQLQAAAPEGMVPGTTAWRRVAPHPAVRAVEALTPGELLASVLVVSGRAARLGTDGWEQTLRVHRSGEDAATGVALQWGNRDDAVAGSDLRVKMRRRAGQWTVESIEERFHCARGVSGALCN